MGLAAARIHIWEPHGRAGRRKATLLRAVFLVSILLAAFAGAHAGSLFDEYEGRQITSIEVAFEGSPADAAVEAEFLSIIRILPNSQFSAVAIREALQA